MRRPEIAAAKLLLRIGKAFERVGDGGRLGSLTRWGICVAVSRGSWRLGTTQYAGSVRLAAWSAIDRYGATARQKWDREEKEFWPTSVCFPANNEEAYREAATERALLCYFIAEALTTEAPE